MLSAPGCQKDRQVFQSDMGKNHKAPQCTATQQQSQEAQADSQGQAHNAAAVALADQHGLAQSNCVPHRPPARGCPVQEGHHLFHLLETHLLPRVLLPSALPRASAEDPTPRMTPKDRHRYHSGWLKRKIPRLGDQPNSYPSQARAL